MRELRWPVIVALGAGGLVRPVLSITGVFSPGQAWAPVLVTVLLAVLWVAVAVRLRVRRPVLTLTLAGVVYGLCAILLNLVLHLFLESAEWIPAPGYVAIVVWNAALGAVLGLIAHGLLRRRPVSLG
jgi:hypothetical protein